MNNDGTKSLGKEFEGRTIPNEGPTYYIGSKPVKSDLPMGSRAPEPKPAPKPAPAPEPKPAPKPAPAPETPTE